MADSTLLTALSLRHERLRKELRDADLGAVVLNPGPTMAYLTGLHFHISERPAVLLFPAEGTPAMVVPELESQKTDVAVFDLAVFTYSESPSTWQTAFDEAAETIGAVRRIGLEPRWLRVLELRFLEAALPACAFVSGEAAVASLRMHKDEVEVGMMRKATEIAQDALSETLKSVRTGITERELAATLIQHMLRLGSGGELPFQPIVAFGPNSANPHAVPTDRALQPGEFLLVDWGANYQGYFSDLTRTFQYGEVEDELQEIARVVEGANAAGRRASGPGISAGSIDTAARDVIDAAGYGEYFVHRTGHGLGLEVHEEPYIRGDNPRILAPGMTFTVEPGIYLPGRGGVRIEDDMVITSEGAESLSDLPRAVSILPIV